MNKRKILDLDPSLVDGLPGACSSCCFWESSMAGSPGSCFIGADKKRWAGRLLETGFAPGKVIMNDDTAIAFLQMAPAEEVPRLSIMPYPPPSRDAVYITCLYVIPEMRSMGLGKLLLTSAERSLYKRRFRLLETHGILEGRFAPPGPEGFFGSCGFKSVGKHADIRLMRLDLRSLAPVGESIQSLLERLPLPSLSRVHVPRPEPRCNASGR